MKTDIYTTFTDFLTAQYKFYKAYSEDEKITPEMRIYYMGCCAVFEAIFVTFIQLWERENNE